MCVFTGHFVVLGVQPLQDIEEVNMFKDDNTVIHFRKPLQSKSSTFCYNEVITYLFAFV